MAQARIEKERSETTRMRKAPDSEGNRSDTMAGS